MEPIHHISHYKLHAIFFLPLFGNWENSMLTQQKDSVDRRCKLVTTHVLSRQFITLPDYYMRVSGWVVYTVNHIQLMACGINLL